MLHAKLVREGFKVNVKVVERIYREERLWLRRTKRKKIPKEGREGGWCPQSLGKLRDVYKIPCGGARYGNVYK